MGTLQFSNQSEENQNNQSGVENIPAELKRLNQWLVWKEEKRDGKITKVPYDPKRPRKMASVTAPATWGSFSQACQATKSPTVAGIGFVFTKADPYVGVDLDECRDPQTGQVEPWAQEIVNLLDSYTEVSPSGDGLHIWTQGSLPPGGRRKGQIEIYEVFRFFTMTGQHLGSTPRTIENRETQLRDLHAQVFAQQVTSKAVAKAEPGNGSASLSDEDIISKAKRAKNGQAFTNLWGGKWEGAYPSQSEADLALCGQLAFWTGRNPEQLDRLFRQSGLFRQKWDTVHFSGGVTYGQQLIGKVVNEQKGFYQPGKGNCASGTTSEQIIPVELAERFLTQSELRSSKGLNLRWYREEWLRFDGKIFQVIPLHDLRAEVMSFLHDSPARKNAGPSLVKNILGNLEGLCRIPSSVCLPSYWENGVWTSNPDTLVFQNGLLNIENLLGKKDVSDVVPHTPNFISRVALPFAFDAKAQCPRWWDFLEQVLPDPESRQLLREIFGYCLTYDTSLQKFFLFEGKGANGKGVVTRILTALLGQENVSTVPLESFDAPHGLEVTLGKLVNIISDINDLDRVAEGRLKEFTGEDLMHFNPKYRTPFSAKPTTRILISTNVRPPFRDRSEGLWRRLIVVPFPVTVSEEQRNPKLTEELIPELPGIFNWAIVGAQALRVNGYFSEPDASKAAKEEYKREANPARIFLEENVVCSPEFSELTHNIYSRYRSYCQENGYHPLNGSNFGKEVKAFFPQVKRERSSIHADEGRPYSYMGLKLVVDCERVEVPF